MATDVAHSVVCVGHTGDLCKNGLTDRDAFFGTDSCVQETVIRWGSRKDESIRSRKALVNVKRQYTV